MFDVTLGLTGRNESNEMVMGLMIQPSTVVGSGLGFRPAGALSSTS